MEKKTGSGVGLWGFGWEGRRRFASNFQFERGVAALIIIIREKRVVEELCQFSRNSYCMLICSKKKSSKAKISLAQKNEGKKKQTPHPPTPLIYPLKISHLVRNPPTCNTPAREGGGPNFRPFLHLCWPCRIIWCVKKKMAPSHLQG